MIAVAGCVAQAEGTEVTARSRDVDIVVGPQAYHDLPNMIARAAQGERVHDLDLPGLENSASCRPAAKPGQPPF
jgi:tRNA-2-methylthio-N6-dimethylallyladenosine synthase